MDSLLLIGLGVFGLVAVASLVAGFIFSRRGGELSERLESVTSVTELAEVSSAERKKIAKRGRLVASPKV